ncbi:hypothetical protein M0802_002504 [Mischocyttarus mexicanus]|nr:hypothetical protein M0802_002504 [Mischocyttarus mexicanus]
MIGSKVFVFGFFLAVSCSFAFPINERTSIIQPVIVVPTILDQDATNPEVFLNDEEKEEVIVPSVILVLDDYLNDPENFLSKEIIDSGPRKIEKREVSVKQEESVKDDLETAAGTNVLRPLFVYRQQLAYRQRLREATRRGNRF